MKRRVRFVRGCSPYLSGEKATFDANAAAKLVNQHLAVYDDLDELNIKSVAAAPKEEFVIDESNEDDDNDNADDESNDDDESESGDGDGEAEGNESAEADTGDKPRKRRKRKRVKAD